MAAVIKCFFRIVLRHMSVICIYLVVFISMCAGFSAQSRELNESIFTRKAVNFAVIDNDNSPLSNALIQNLERDNNLTEYKDVSTEVIKDALYNQEIEYALFIPRDFERSFAAGTPQNVGTAQAAGSMSSGYLDNSVNQFLNVYKTYLSAGFESGGAIAKALSAAALKGEAVMLDDNAADDVPPVYYYFDFLAYALMTVMMMGLAPILKLFLDNSARLSCSPTSTAKINLSLAASSAMFAAACFAVLWLYGVICYGGDMFTPSARICLSGALCFVPCCMGLAYLIAHASKNPATVNAAGNAVSIALCFLGGVYVPLEIMSDEILNVAQFTPTYQYVRVVERAWKYASLTPAQQNEIYTFMGMELLFGAAFFAVALALSARRRET